MPTASSIHKSIFRLRSHAMQASILISIIRRPLFSEDSSVNKTKQGWKRFPPVKIFPLAGCFPYGILGL
jgi:hypothetical protein